VLLRVAKARPARGVALEVKDMPCATSASSRRWAGLLQRAQREIVAIAGVDGNGQTELIERSRPAADRERERLGRRPQLRGHFTPRMMIDAESGTSRRTASAAG